MWLMVLLQPAHLVVQQWAIWRIGLCSLRNWMLPLCTYCMVMQTQEQIQKALKEQMENHDMQRALQACRWSAMQHLCLRWLPA